MVNDHMVVVTVVSLLVQLLLILMGHQPLVMAQHHFPSSLDCSGENEEVARFQLYVGSTTPGAHHWQLRCNNSTELIWNQTILVRSRSRSNSRGNGTDATTTATVVVVVPPDSWWYEHHCVAIDTDTCEFSLTTTSPDTFYALVVGATTITVSNQERGQQQHQTSIHDTVCFGRDCHQPPLETDDDDHDDDTTTTTTSVDDATTERKEGEDTSFKGEPNDAIQQNSSPTVKLIRQRGFIIWIVSMVVILGMILLVWYCTIIKVRQQNQLEEDDGSDRKDDETLRAESGGFDESTSRDG